jgi:hypothetical protein
MSERESLLEVLQRLAEAGCIDARIFVRTDDTNEVEAHLQAVPVVVAQPPRRHLETL